MCDACLYEFDEAIHAQDVEGLFFATSIDREFEDSEHFYVWMVDDDGSEEII